MSDTFEMQGAACPAPIQDYQQVLMGHGGGGKLSSELVEHVFAPEFTNPHVNHFADSTLVPVSGTRIAISTDSYVVQPLFFPGGDIGKLAVHGTVNDLAMSGAVPKYLTAGFILEEGFAIKDLQRIARSMGQAAAQAGVAIVAGDTKVVQRGHGDGVYINTAGVGLIDQHVDIHPTAARPGDVVLLSGPIGNHGMAIMSVREHLDFESPIRSDTADLSGMVRDMIAASSHVRSLRDPTRGGLATSLNEIASASGVGIELDVASIPVDECVRGACEFLGLDPMLVANEGKLVAIVDPADAELVLSAMKNHPAGHDACVIGHVVSDPHRLVVGKTVLGAKHVITVPVGEQLPRIC